MEIEKTVEIKSEIKKGMKFQLTHLEFCELVESLYEIKMYDEFEIDLCRSNHWNIQTQQSEDWSCQFAVRATIMKTGSVKLENGEEILK